MSELAKSSPWLTIVGIGEDGIAGLGERTKRRIATAELVCGGKRHLDLAAGLITGGRHQWLSPIEKSVEFIRSRRGRDVCVLASGDPFHFGMGATLSRSIDASEMLTIPAPSSFSLAASRLGWPVQDTALLSLHGRSLDLIRPHLQPGARIIALTSDENGPYELAALLTRHGFGGSNLAVLEALGGEREKITRHRAETFELQTVDALNVCAIDVAAGPDARIIPLAAGIDDGLFEHNGQITKREIRAVTLSALAPRRGELLWDIGGGSGSISIEWMLAHCSMRAIAVEANAERAARIGRNGASFGVPGLRVVTGSAPEALIGLDEPDAIFVGGGGSDPGVMDAAIAALKPGGRLVANAVTLEMEALLLTLQTRLGGSLTRIEISRAATLGGMQGWRPAMPVTQWNWVRKD